MIEADVINLYFEYELSTKRKMVLLDLYHMKGNFNEYWGQLSLRKFYPGREIEKIKEMDIAAILSLNGLEEIARSKTSRYLRLNIRKKGDRSYHCIELEL